MTWVWSPLQVKRSLWSKDSVITIRLNANGSTKAKANRCCYCFSLGWNSYKSFRFPLKLLRYAINSTSLGDELPYSKIFKFALKLLRYVINYTTNIKLQCPNFIGSEIENTGLPIHNPSLLQLTCSFLSISHAINHWLPWGYANL